MGYVGMSDYLLNAVLKHIHNETTYTSPTTYLALFVGDPLGAGMEVSGTSYARQDVSWNGVAAGTNEYTDENFGEISFPEATTDWGTVTHAVTYDAPTGGNMLEVFELAVSRNVVTGVITKIASGDLDSHLKRESI